MTTATNSGAPIADGNPHQIDDAELVTLTGPTAGQKVRSLNRLDFRVKAEDQYFSVRVEQTCYLTGYPVHVQHLQLNQRTRSNSYAGLVVIVKRITTNPARLQGFASHHLPCTTSKITLPQPKVYHNTQGLSSVKQQIPQTNQSCDQQQPADRLTQRERLRTIKDRTALLTSHPMPVPHEQLVAMLTNILILPILTGVVFRPIPLWVRISWQKGVVHTPRNSVTNSGYLSQSSSYRS